MIGKSILAAGLALCGTAFGQNLKIGTVNMETLMENFEQTQVLESVLEKQVQDIRNEIDEMSRRYEEQRSVVTNLQNEVDDRAISDESRQQKMAQLRRQAELLQDMRSELLQVREQRRNELGEQRRRMHATVMDSITAHVTKFAEEEGYDLVLDKAALAINGVRMVVFATDALDVTEQVLKTMPTRKTEE